MPKAMQAEAKSIR